ncbi:hypothetical protein DSO57_1018490 [Entomophthora muscae]|uniref:Uncharacterized protein n=2 Tax=Entomophthora muscae TaxID=34485 RepID=A0ACC2TRE5_9FUNG|nr:hypothetical protein DSO57_1034856 [Entomophthora muscae]KAJ9077258.1 hypothetical protein DSO57_1018490 [Entomophthora muscae]
MLGLGVGFNIQATMVASQASLPEPDMPIASALTSFSVTMGGIIGLAIHSTILKHLVATNFNRILPGITQAMYLKSLDPDLTPLVEIIYLNAYRLTFITMAPVITTGAIAAFFIKEIHVPSL